MPIVIVPAPQVRPVMYSPAREEQLHLWDLSALPSPAHK